jgi:uncharacterized protein YbjT (DUF2867 family)
VPGERGMTTLETGFWRDRPTLVTGGTGLVGSWVVRRLLELEADVVCLLREIVRASSDKAYGDHPILGMAA